MANNVVVDPEVRAAQAYDVLMEEMRILDLSNVEAEIALSMMMGAILAIAYSDDVAVIDSMKRITEEAGHYYEKAKSLSARQKQEEREVIKLDDA